MLCTWIQMHMYINMYISMYINIYLCITRVVLLVFSCGRVAWNNCSQLYIWIFTPLFHHINFFYCLSLFCLCETADLSICIPASSAKQVNAHIHFTHFIWAYSISLNAITALLSFNSLPSFWNTLFFVSKICYIFKLTRNFFPNLFLIIYLCAGTFT